MDNRGLVWAVGNLKNVGIWSLNDVGKRILR